MPQLDFEGNAVVGDPDDAWEWVGSDGLTDSQRGHPEEEAA